MQTLDIKKQKYSPFSDMLKESEIPKYIKRSFKTSKHKKFFSIKSINTYQEEDLVDNGEEQVIALSKVERDFSIYFKVSYGILNKEKASLEFTVEAIQKCSKEFSYSAVYSGIIHFDIYDYWKVTNVALRPVIEKSAASLVKWIEDSSFEKSKSIVRIYYKNSKGEKVFRDQKHRDESIFNLMKKAAISRIVKAHYAAKN